MAKVLSNTEIKEIVDKEGSIKTLPALIRKVKEMFEDDTDTEAYYEGRFGNTRWRLFGPDSDSDAKGELNLANHELFDRWANSLTVTIHLWEIAHEEGSFKNVITNAFNIYS
jgi:hypothetical protein